MSTEVLYFPAQGYYRR